MAKVAIKYDNIVPYGGIFYAMNEFDIPNGGKGTLYAHISQDMEKQFEQEKSHSGRF